MSCKRAWSEIVLQSSKRIIIEGERNIVTFDRRINYYTLLWPVKIFKIGIFDNTTLKRCSNINYKQLCKSLVFGRAKHKTYILPFWLENLAGNWEGKLCSWSRYLQVWGKSGDLSALNRHWTIRVKDLQWLVALVFLCSPDPLQINSLNSLLFTVRFPLEM